MQHFHKTAHVSPFVVVGQIDIHVYGGNRVLEAVAPIKNRNGILQILYTDFVDRNAAIIALILDIFDF